MLVFTGADTPICVETSLRDGFNIGYDVMVVSDATASRDKKHYETTLERVRDYYGLVMDSERFKKAINSLDKIRTGELDLKKDLDDILEEFDLLDPRAFDFKPIPS